MQLLIKTAAIAIVFWFMCSETYMVDYLWIEMESPVFGRVINHMISY
jgi:hypothetical protein